LIAIAFWSWLWGAAGLVLSVPLTVCLVVLGKHFPSLAFLDILLGDDTVLAADLQFYQRLLARDQDEAFEIARERIEKAPLARVFDEVFIPALTSARSDFEAGLISEHEAASIFEVAREIVEEIGSGAANAAKAAEEKESEGKEAEAKPAVPVPPRPQLKIMACAARDAADEVAIEMLCRVLDPKINGPQVVSTDHLVSEIITMVEEERPAIVCVGSLPPGGLAHTRLLCKRLRGAFPDLKIIVGRWGLREEGQKKNRDQLLAAGADQFGTTLEESAVQLEQLQQLIVSMATSQKVPQVVTAEPFAASQKSA
jgi:hypothetical protein